jgi:hypothetical protein
MNSLDIPLNNIKNIAVCFSGEPRMYNLCSDSIRYFFDLPNVNVKFFAHTWNSNSYKVGQFPNAVFENEEYTIDFIKDDMHRFYNFEFLEVEKKFETDQVWDHLFYSEAKANLQKRIYEQRNNMTFDIVVKCRFDLAFEPGLKFTKVYNRPKRIHQKTIYANNCLMVNEFYLTNIDDVFYYGSSYTMDLLQSNMYWINKSIYNNLEKYNSLNNQSNPFLDRNGPGVRMFLFCKQLNIVPHNIPRNFLIYRKEQIPRDPVVEYKELLREGGRIF